MDRLDKDLIEIKGFLKGLAVIKANPTKKELDQLHKDAIRLSELLELSIDNRNNNA